MEALERIIDKVLNWLNTFFGVKTAQQRYQVINVTVDNGTLAGTLEEIEVTLDKSFNKIVGIAYHEITDGGQTDNYNVGAASNTKVWVDKVNINSWNADSGVGPMEKFRKVNISYGQGDSFKAQITPNADLTSDLTGQMVLILQRDLTELPR